MHQAAPDQIGDRSGQESSKDESYPQRIYGIRYQTIEDALEGQNTSIETSEVDEAFGGLIEAEGPEARNRSRSSTVKPARDLWQWRWIRDFQVGSISSFWTAPTTSGLPSTPGLGEIGERVRLVPTSDKQAQFQALLL